MRADEAFAERSAGLDPRQRHFLMELAYGAIRWRALLHHHLDALLPKGRGGLPPDVLAVLELGAYQLLFMDRVPAWSAVDESVALMRTTAPAAWAPGLVNGVLRNLDRRRETPPLPDDPAARLAVRHSHPQWLVARWLDRFGPEATEALLAHDNTPPLLHLCVNPARATREAALERIAAAGHDARPHETAPDGIVVVSRASPEDLPGWDEGWFWAQDAGAQWVTHAAPAAPGARVLDACAAPGSKLAALLARGAGPALAVDVDPRRLRRVAANLARLELDAAPRGARLVAADARALPTRAAFDHVLADVPCTGTGVLRRRVDARWRRRPGDPATFATFQRELLAAVAAHVAPGGTLVYATCSLEREENEGVVEPFLAEHPAFTLAPLDDTVPPALRSGPYLFTRPWAAGDMDGMFAARLVRGGE